MANEPKVPLVLTIAERDFESVFKPFLKEVIKGKSPKRGRISNVNIVMDMQMRKDVIHGFSDVDFDTMSNMRVLEEITEDAWKKFKMDFSLILKKYNKEFSKKSGKV